VLAEADDLRMNTDRTVPSASKSPDSTPTRSSYVFAGNSAARDLFNQRSVEQDAPVVAQHLQRGMHLVDLGCGAGSLTCDFARLIAPGEVLGVDASRDAIDRARALAEQSGLSNVRFEVADINELKLPSEHFDVTHFSNVLRYLREPEQVVQLAFGCLKSGGMIAACEAHHAGNWVTGPKAESIVLITRVVQEENEARGGDSLLGGRLPVIFHAAGFERVVSKPVYSAVLSDTRAVGTLVRSGWSGHFRPMLIRHGITEERCHQLLEEIAMWAESEDSIAAFAECAVIASKP
jgi:SAM-dependent methyltransferase